MDLHIRPEHPAEFAAIHALVHAAFLTAPHVEGDEAEFVDRQRAGPGYLPELALVAVGHGELIGHILLNRVAIDTPAGQHPILLLAELAVAQSHRNRGVGAALVEAALSRARRHGHRAVVLVGDPAYYARFGFRPAHRSGLENRNGIEPEYVQVLTLHPAGLDSVAGSILLPQ